MRIKIICLASIYFLGACAHLSSAPQRVQTATSKNEENDILNAEKLLALGRNEEARIQFRNFQENYSQSLYFQSARLGEAQALEALGQWSEAIALDRDVYLKTLKQQPEIAALALYRMSFSYEALGDDTKTLAALLDARNMQSHLPSEVALAEVPARLAALYGRMEGREQEAMKYLSEAEKGIESLRQSRQKTDSSWLAKTYFQMGSLSTNQLSADNYEQSIEGQKMVQVYLLKALQLNEPAWSKKSLEQLKNTYQRFFNLFESQKTDRQRQVSMGGSLTDLIQQAELFRPLRAQVANNFEKDFFSYLSEVSAQTEKALYQNGESMSLTDESQKLHSLKRPGKVKVESLLPEEHTNPLKALPKVVPTEDPNL